MHLPDDRKKGAKTSELRSNRFVCGTKTDLNWQKNGSHRDDFIKRHECAYAIERLVQLLVDDVIQVLHEKLI